MSADCKNLGLFGDMDISDGPSYYEILGVGEKATQGEIKAAYKTLVHKWHPDKNSDPQAEAKFKDISEAGRTLRDPKKREGYDIFGKIDPDFLPPLNPHLDLSELSNLSSRRANAQEDIFNGAFNHPHFQQVDVFDTFDLDGVLKLIDEVREEAGLNERQGVAVQYDVRCSLKELYHGTVKKFKVTTTDYSGDTPVSKADLKVVQIFPGWKAGTKITFEKAGDKYPELEPSDITFILREKPHMKFTRHGDDLHMDMVITLKEALYGFGRTFLTIDRVKNEIKIPMLDTSDYIHIIKDGGMPKRKDGRLDGHGDLVIKFIIDLKAVSAAKKKKIITMLRKS